MVEIPSFTSTKDLIKEVVRQASEGVHRDPLLDAREFLRLEGIKWTTNYEQEEIPDRPTLFVANHFRRKRFDRRPFISANTILNSRESFITTSLVEDGAAKFCQRRISWLVEDEIREKFLSFQLFDPSVQKTFIDCYGEIPVSKTLSGMRDFTKKLESAFKNGRNIGVYPEGKTGYEVGEPNPAFAGFIRRLQKSHPNFQIVPVNISFRSGEYSVGFKRVIEPAGNPEEIVGKVMSAIAPSV